MTFAQLERTPKYAYSQAPKFISKYGVVSGLAELVWQFHLTKEEAELVFIRLFEKQYIQEWAIESALNEAF